MAAFIQSSSICPTRDEVTLSDLVKNFGKSLPYRVKICKGFYGFSDKSAITIGDTYNILYRKNSQVSQYRFACIYTCMNVIL